MSAPRVITGHPQLTMHREWTGLTALDLGADRERRKDDACNSLSAASSSPAVDALRRRHPLADKFSTNRAPRFYRDFAALCELLTYLQKAALYAYRATFFVVVFLLLEMTILPT